MRPDSICFDLDDTLYPYAEYARTGLQAAGDRLAAQTGRRLTDELLELYFESGVTTGTFDRLVERYDDVPPSLVSDLVAAYHDADAPIEPYEATVPVLQDLRDEYQLGVVTDGRNGGGKLRRLGLDEGYFDAVVVAPEHDTSKHHPEPFDEALAALSVDPERTVYVGDDPRVDFTVPNRLGMGTVRLRRGRYTDLDPAEPKAVPDAEIQNLDELPAVLESAESGRECEQTREA